MILYTIAWRTPTLALYLCCRRFDVNCVTIIDFLICGYFARKASESLFSHIRLRTTKSPDMAEYGAKDKICDFCIYIRLYDTMSYRCK